MRVYSPCTKRRMAKMVMERKSAWEGKSVSRARIRAVARISAMVQGRTASRMASTAGFLIKFLSTIEISRMIMKAGRMTPNVANKAPSRPA